MYDCWVVDVLYYLLLCQKKVNVYNWLFTEKVEPWIFSEALLKQIDFSKVDCFRSEIIEGGILWIFLKYKDNNGI